MVTITLYSIFNENRNIFSIILWKIESSNEHNSIYLKQKSFVTFNCVLLSLLTNAYLQN